MGVREARAESRQATWSPSGRARYDEDAAVIPRFRRFPALGGGSRRDGRHEDPRRRRDVGLQLGPTGKTILTGDDELRSTESDARCLDLVGGRCPEPRMIRLYAPERLGVSGLVA